MTRSENIEAAGRHLVAAMGGDEISLLRDVQQLLYCVQQREDHVRESSLRRDCDRVNIISRCRKMITSAEGEMTKEPESCLDPVDLLRREKEKRRQARAEREWAECKFDQLHRVSSEMRGISDELLAHYPNTTPATELKRIASELEIFSIEVMSGKG